MTAAQQVRGLKRVRSRIPGDPQRFLADPRRALVLGLVLFALFVLLAFVVPQAPLELEQRWNEWMSDIATFVLKDIALVFNALGRGVGRALLIAAPAAVLLVARRRWSLAAFALTEALTPLISSITKVLVDRPRPPAPLVHPSGASFPSGHSAFAGATAVAAHPALHARRAAEATVVVPRRARNGGDGVEPHLPARALAARRHGGVDSRRGRRSNRLRRRPAARDPPLRWGF